MANVIRLKRASGSDPTASDLVSGEPAVRTDTGELFFKKDDGSVAKVSGAGGGPDFKYLALRNAANNGAASFPNADFTLVTSGTTSAITPTAANTLLVSVNGVIQKPNTGTSTPSQGFALSGSTIKFGANISAAPDFILYQESGGIGEPSDETVSEEKLKVSNSPVNGYFLSAQSGNNGGLTWAAPVATSCTGNSATATALATARTINGTSFDGTANITVTAAAGTLTGNTLNSSVTASSLTSLGDLSGLTVTGNMTVDTNTLFVNSSNNQVGIGTTNPTCKLQINAGSGSDGTVTFLELNHGGNQTNDAVKLNFARAGGDIGSIVLEKVASNNTTDFIFNTRSSNTVSESMRISGDGKVGIGTTSPVNKLHINSGATNTAALFESSDTEVAIQLKDTTGSSVIKARNDFRFDNSTGELMRIDSSGNVGIGTTSPTYQLDVQTASGDAQIRLKALGTGSSDDTVFRMLVAGTTQDNFIYFGDTDDSNAGQIRYNHNSDFLTLTANASERMRIDSSGLVGIGTTSPAAPFHVYNATNNTIARLESGDATARLHLKDNSGEAFVEATADNLIFSNTSSTTERMRIDSSGRLLIGATSAPNNAMVRIQGRTVDGSSTTIDLDGTGTSGPLLEMRSVSSDSNQLAVLVLNQASLKSAIAASRPNSGNWGTDLRFYTHKDATSDQHQSYERMRIDSSGRLLIGTTTEGHAAADNLTVADTANSGITIRSGTSSTGAIYFSDGTSGSAEYKGAVRYTHSNNALGFYVNGSERLGLSSSGVLQLKNTSGNVRMSFENSGGLNFITSNSGEEIKVSSGNGDSNGIEFWDYTGVNKRCQIDGHGIKFGTDTAEANALDDYEFGTWTPTFDAPDQSSTTFGHHRQHGYYTKIGNIVHVTCYIQGFADQNASGGSNDGVVITGLPFTVAPLPSTSNVRHAASFALGSRYRVICDDLLCHAYGNTTNAGLWEPSSGNVMGRLKSNDITARGGTNEIYFAGSYRVA